MDFIRCLMLEAVSACDVSLQDHVIQLFKLSGIRIKSQSLNERFTSAAVNFLKRLVEMQIRSKIAINVGEVVTRFTSIRIQDSCRFALPSSMSTLFKGYGGRSAESIANIQFCYDLKGGQINHLQLHDGSYQDQTAARDFLRLNGLEKGMLIIRDLGYFVLDVFQKINDSEAYFLSRLLPKTLICELEDNQYKPLDIKKIKAKLKKGSISCVEKMVWLGQKKQFSARLYISLAADEVVQQRLRKVNKYNKGKGRQTSDEYKTYATLNMFITNADDQLLKTEDIPTLYRLRWQVELIFKTWKSYYRIDELKNVNRYRILCYIYSSLLLLLLHWEIFRAFDRIQRHYHNNSLSVQKFTKSMVTSLNEQNIWFNFIDKSMFEDHLVNLYDLCATYMVRQKRKNRMNYDDVVEILKPSVR